MEVFMANPFDDLAALVGRVLARRWLRDQGAESDRDCVVTAPPATDDGVVARTNGQDGLASVSRQGNVAKSR
jgi:hypothetical protein